MKKSQLVNIIRETIQELTVDKCEKQCHSFKAKEDFMAYATCRKRCIMKSKYGEKHVAVADALGLQ